MRAEGTDMLRHIVFVLAALFISITAFAQNPMRLTRHEIRDVTMGIVSHTAALPDGWKMDGKVEWSQGDMSYPQIRYDLLSPGGGRVRTFPMVAFSYTEMNPVPGFDPMPPQGTPAPEDFPNWLLQTVEQRDPRFTQMRLLESHRDEKIEASLDEIDRNTNANTQGMQREVLVMTCEYLEEGKPRKEYDIMVYTRLAPIINENIRSQTWTFYPMCMLSAPTDSFDKELPALQQAALSVKPTPQWFLASQKLIAELSRLRAEERWRAIQERGKQLNRINDDDYRTYKQSMAASDEAQRGRIQSIYETEDFRDTSGAVVNLPIHYKHVFSDGNGNYMLTNNSLDKPGETWKEIERMK